METINRRQFLNRTTRFLNEMEGHYDFRTKCDLYENEFTKNKDLETITLLKECKKQFSILLEKDKSYSYDFIDSKIEEIKKQLGIKD